MLLSEEMFLSEYFLFETILGSHCGKFERIFNCLGEIFFVPPAKRKALRALAECDTVREIGSEKEYFRFCRLKEFIGLTGLSAQYTAEQEEAATIKGQAIMQVGQCEFKLPDDATEAAVFKAISDAAQNGMIIALRLLGILSCEGALAVKNRETGLSNLRRAAEWGNTEALLALLRYDKESRVQTLTRLYTVTNGTPYERLYQRAAAKCGVRCEEYDCESALLEKAFGGGILKREVHNPQFARVLYSKTLSLKDKEKIFFSKREAFTEASDLPLRLPQTEFLPFNEQVFRDMPLQRREEQDKIVQGVNNADLRFFDTFRPLCLCAETKFVSETYAEALVRALPDCHVERIDFSSLTEYDLEPTGNHILVRSCNEDKPNVFLLFMRGHVSPRISDGVKLFLQSASRGKFHLNQPNVSIDLRSVLPICFCDAENAKDLEKYCDVVHLSEPNGEEMHNLIGSIIEGKRAFYGIERIETAQAVSEELEKLPIDVAETVLDNAIRSHRKRGEAVNLTEELMLAFFKNVRDHKTTFGFGGSNHEDR